VSAQGSLSIRLGFAHHLDVPLLLLLLPARRPVKGEAEPLSRRPLGLQAGWSVARACTTPYLGQVDDDKIEFGELIGSGSFGRVFLAK
jgi:hypothetical protein